MKRLILDCDVGTDDALALLILLKADQQKLVKIEAICCSMGNTTLENVCKNVIRLLEITNRTDIPVYKGIQDALIKRTDLICTYHGTDGLGDIPFENSPDMTLIKKEVSPLAMYNMAQKYRNDIYLMVLGPLTNAALAIKMFPEFTGYLKEIFIMGGNCKGVGNVTKAAEFNFHVDPEAAYITLKEATCPITILPWETCLLPTVSFDWRWNVFGKIDHEAIQILTLAEKKVYFNSPYKYWKPCDAFLAAAFVQPDCVLSNETYHATVELHGYETRGQLILDHRKTEKDNVTILTGIDTEIFKHILLNLSTL